MSVIRFHLVRHTRRFDVMMQLYRDQLGFTVIEAWNESHSRGALIPLGCGCGSTRI